MSEGGIEMIEVEEGIRSVRLILPESDPLRVPCGRSSSAKSYITQLRQSAIALLHPTEDEPSKRENDSW